MDLREILNPEIIDLRVKGNTKREVLENLSIHLLEQGYIEDVKQFVDDIFLREAEGPTGMGEGLSIPHGKSETVKKIGIAIGRTLNPIAWESDISDSGWQETNLIFLFCVSVDNSYAENHLLLLSELAGKLGNYGRVQSLLSAETADEIIEGLVSDKDEYECDRTSEEEIVELDIAL
ncbi:PTS system, fructose subfamily, IIA component [Lachnospiraceae bacterium JC7]|nr:PTS system, fructose subfamily, IIA component [Lachnospiraceae bacterium JC7]